jgi:hypothetical protein
MLEALDNDQLRAVVEAFDLVCEELGISLPEADRRHGIALAILAAADQREIESIKRRAMNILKTPTLLEH